MPCLCNEVSLWWTPTPHLNQGNLQEMEPRPELEHSVLKHLDHQIKNPSHFQFLHWLSPLSKWKLILK